MIRICELGLYSKVICVTSRYFALFLDYNVGAQTDSLTVGKLGLFAGTDRASGGSEKYGEARDR